MTADHQIEGVGVAVAESVQLMLLEDVRPAQEKSSSRLQHTAHLAEGLPQQLIGHVLDHVGGEDLVAALVRERDVGHGPEEFDVGQRARVEVDVARPRSVAGTDLQSELAMRAMEPRVLQAPVKRLRHPADRRKGDRATIARLPTGS